MAKLPLEGVRIVDLTVVWAGPFATQILGDLGAEVIKLENPHVWQTYTRGIRARPPKAMLDGALPIFGGYPDGEPGDRPWNRPPTFIHLYRNKKSVAVDLRKDWGKEFLRRLVAISDVVYENNVPETLEKLGVTYEWLKSIKPDIIFVRVPAFGLAGAYRNYRALGVHIEGVTSHTRYRGYTDMDPSANTDIYAADYLAGAQGAFAVMAALLHRRRTGEGQLVEIPQSENALAMLAFPLMDYAINRRVRDRVGNRSILGHAPQGVYPCAGEDRWIAISCTSDAEWSGLCRTLGHGEWAGDPRFATMAGRCEHHGTLDELIAAETRGHEMRALTERLQAAGVPAGPVLDARDAMEDPHLRARGFFYRVPHEDIGEREWPGFLFQLSSTPLSCRQPPVRMGEHSAYVYKELLGYSDEEYRRLEEAGEITMDFDPSVP